MHSGLLDVVIVAPLPAQDDRLESVVLDDEKLYLAVASDHRLAKQRSVDLRQAAGEFFIALTPGHGLRQALDQTCRQAGFQPALAFEGEEVATLRGLVGGTGNCRAAQSAAHAEVNRRTHHHQTPVPPPGRRSLAEGSPAATGRTAVHRLPEHLRGTGPR
jgi:LysR family transcriptional activator of glutamate synthase operon